MSLPPALALAVVALCTSAVFAQDVVTNGGFEELDANGAPVDWGVMGAVTSTAEAHSGERAVVITRTPETEGEVGLNRAWEPLSGKRGAMLDRLVGGIRFWYRVPSASPDAVLTLYIIPMSAKPLEEGGRRAEFQVPSAHYGDGQWHEGVVAYDFREMEGTVWVHISPRVTGQSAEWILDDVSWAETVGPFLSIPRFDVLPGRDVLRASIANAGDQPLPAPTVSVTGPDGVALEPVGTTETPSTLEPGGTTHLHWRMNGAVPEGSVFTLSASPADGSDPITVPLKAEPTLDVYSLQAEDSVLTVGQETTVTLSAYNHGPADAPGVSLEVTLPPELELVGDLPGPGPVPARGWASHYFRVRALRETHSTALRGIARRGAEEWPVTSELVVVGDGETTLLWNSNLRLVGLPIGADLGACRIDVQKDREVWKPVAWMPHLGRVTIVNSEGQDETLRFTVIPEPAGAGLALKGRTRDSGGAEWTLEVEIEIGETVDAIRIASEVRCNRNRRVRAFEGPSLHVVTLGADALFPGLEWLEGDEVSSSCLDIARGHADQVRHAPHPNKITIPLMSASDGSATVGLLWDCNEPWDGEHDRPSAVFSCPGYLDGHRAATMGLFVPNAVGGWVEENALSASAPYDLPANRPLTLSARIFASKDSTTALDAMDRWLDLYGVIEPASLPRGHLESEVEFSAQAYMTSLYSEEDGLWWASKGGGPIMSLKGLPGPHYTWNLLRAANITRHRGLRGRYLEWVEKMKTLTGATPRSVDMGFEHGGAGETVQGMLASSAWLITTQLPDGGWDYDADRAGWGPFIGFDYWTLADDGLVELGTIAENATRLLKTARMTGSPECYEAGLRALEAMRRFAVPRAAQVWEVPGHSPDILAAAQAIEAFVEAYRYDGDPYWLDQARYWARTGLPFVYLWDDPDQPFLRHASIPVFGATLFQGSWFGRPVQWNGIRYASALFEFAEYDDSRPWARIAEGIVVSAMYRQATEGDDLALWPDSIGAVKGDKSAWVFEPGQILDQVYRLMDQDPYPRTTILGERPERVHITANGDVTEATWDADAVAFTITYPMGLQGEVLVANVSRPETVLLDGAPLAESPDWPGWTYETNLGATVVRVPDSGPHAIRIAGVRFSAYSLMPEPASEIAFEFDESAEGWLPLSAVTSLRHEEGAVVFETTGPDPYVHREALSLTGAADDVIVLRMRCTGAPGGQLYWRTASAGFYSEERVVQIDSIPDGEWREYRLAVGEHPGWRGARILSLRLDPTGGGPGEVAIDWMRRE